MSARALSPARPRRLRALLTVCLCAAAGIVRGQRFDPTDLPRANDRPVSEASRPLTGVFSPSPFFGDRGSRRPAEVPMTPVTREAMARLRRRPPDCEGVRSGLQTGVADKDAWASYFRGALRRQGECFERDAAAARADLERSAQGGLIAGQRLLAFVCATGEGGPRDGECARRWARKAAVREDYFSMRLLGYLTEAGLGGKADEEKAADWFRRAAEAGDGHSAWWLVMRAERGVADRKSFQWREIASRTGTTPADFWLETARAGGWGDPSRAGRAVGALETLANGGDADAMLALAMLGDEAGSGRVTVEEGRRRLAQAAEAGSRDARRIYGLRLIEGKDYPADRAGGMRWLRAAADAGDRAASWLYGAVLSEQPGSGDDRAEAWARMRWGNGAGADVAPLLAALEASMTPAEREAGERRLRELGPAGAPPATR